MYSDKNLMGAGEAAYVRGGGGSIIRNARWRAARWAYRNIKRLPIPRGRTRIARAVEALAGDDGVVEFDIGQRMIVHLSDHIERAIYRRGEYEPEVTAAFRQLVGKGSIVFDVGAHVGYYTLIAAARVGQNGSVHSFEPVPAIFRRLHNNVAINTFGDIHLVNRALSDSDRRLSIYPASGNNSGTSSVLPGQDKFAEPLFVEVTTVDQYVTDTSLSHVDLLKIDVEGWELNVLKGAGQSLKVYRPDVITEMSDPFFRQAGYDEEAVITFMGGHGYSAFRIANTEGAFPYAYFSCAPRLDLPPWNGGFRAVFS